MKRDNDYLRTLLLKFEADDSALVFVSRELNPSQEKSKFGYHVELLCDAGFMRPVSTSDYRVTSQGHDFLESIRDEAIWEKTKAGVNKIGGATLSVFASIAVAYGKQAIEDKLGLKL